MQTIIIIDEKCNIRIARKLSADLADFNVLIDSDLIRNHIVTLVATAGNKTARFPLTKGTKPYNGYDAYTVDLTAETIQGSCDIWFYGVDMDTHEYFCTDSVATDIVCDKYKEISAQTNARLINSDIAATFSRITKLTDLNIKIHDEIEAWRKEMTNE